MRFENISGSHTSDSIKGMIPEGARTWRSALNGTFNLPITLEGANGYMCTPLLKNGIVALIVAGDPGVNLDQARAVEHPVRAQIWFEILFNQLDRNFLSNGG